MKSLTWRNVHFWLSLIMVAQLALWMLSGVGFALLPVDELRGRYESRNEQPARLVLDDATVPVSDVVRRIESRLGQQADIDKVTLSHRPGGRLVYLIAAAGERDPWLYDARTGEHVPLITEAEAVEIARHDFADEGAVTAVQWIAEGYGDSIEYSGPFPAYRVDFSNAKRTRLYISPFSGHILRRHNIYQSARNLFWTLHVFGYLQRDVAGNVPLLVTSGVSLMGIMSGTMLLVPYFRRRAAAILSASESAPALTAQAQRE